MPALTRHFLNKVIYLLAVLTIGTVVSDCSNPAGPSRNSDTPDNTDSVNLADTLFTYGKVVDNTYLNDSIGIKVAPPPGWSVTLASSAESGDTVPVHLAAMAPIEDAGNVHATINVFTGHYDGTLGDCEGESSLMEAGIRGDAQWSELVFLPSGKIPVADTSACSIHFRGAFSDDTPTGLEMEMRQVVFVYNNNLIIVTLADEADTFSKSDESFLAMLKNGLLQQAP